MPDGQPPDLLAELMALLRAPSTCYITTLMPDGSPQLTQTWVDTDGEHVLINTVQGFQKLRNMERDARVAVAVSDPDRPARYITVRGQ
jgi:PPOX class probable F420-dependent enzyme